MVRAGASTLGTHVGPGVGRPSPAQWSIAVTSPYVRIDPGTSVGPYVVERRMARGGTSVPYLARDAAGGRVVLKVIPPELATRATRARLVREARALAVVDHPGIVRVHGTGEHNGAPWIAMDYVHGIDLGRVISEHGPLPPEVALRYVTQAAEALSAAHDVGVVHRDLRPSNLLLTSGGRIVLVDFGVARRRPDPREGDAPAAAREIVGTPAYLSPEQLEHGLADERSDVWALGCVLYELVVGTPPFGRIGQATMEAILHDEPTFPPQVSSTVANIISACLRKSSFARIASPRELLPLLRDALEDPRMGQFASGERISALPVEAGARQRYPSSGSFRGEVSPRPPSMPSSRAAAPERPPSVPPPRSLPGQGTSSAAPPRSSGSSGSIRAVAAQGRIKGTAVRAALVWFADVYGAGAVARVHDLASPELKAFLRLGDPACGIMASTWYDTQRIGELVDLLERVASPDDPEAFRSSLAQAIARDNVGGVYRALFRLISSPAMLAANGQRVWQTYSDEGTLTIRLEGPGSFRIFLRRWSRHNASVCRLLRALLEEMLRAVGYTGLVVERTQCVEDGHGECVFEGTWLP